MSETRARYVLARDEASDPHATPSQRRRARKRQRNAGRALGRTRWLQYETLKAALPSELTPQQYEQALRGICRKLGI